MMSYENFVENKYDAFQRSELSPMGLTTLLSLPTVTGFIAYGVTLGALILTPYLSFKAISFVSPVFVASIIGGTIGLFAGALTILYLLPLLAFSLRVVTDFIVNGSMTFQYLVYCAGYVAKSEAEHLYRIHDFMEDLKRQTIIDTQPKHQSRMLDGLTPAQNALYSHIKALHERFAAGELTLYKKLDKRIVELKTQRAQEWLWAERSSRYHATHKPDSDRGDHRLTLLNVSHGYNFFDPIYYLLSLYQSSYDYRMHPGHLKLNVTALEQLQLHPLSLRYCDDPINLLLAMSVDQFKQFKQDIIEKDARYRSMSLGRINRTMSAIEAELEAQQHNAGLQQACRYGQFIQKQTQLWAKAVPVLAEQPIGEMDQTHLKLYLGRIRNNLELSSGYEKLRLSYEVKRVENTLAEMVLVANPTPVGP